MAEDRLALRATFDEDAQRYDRARPTYPDVVFDAISARLPQPGGRTPRVLEIGCGTGQATRPLAERGYRVLAVDLGVDMVEVARRNLAKFPQVEVVRADAEQWDPPSTGFDLVLSATAFHWLDPASRFARVASWLRPGGLLALIQTIHIAGPCDAFFIDAQRCYEQFDPDTPDGGMRLLHLGELPDVGEYGIEQAEEFQAVELQRFAVDHHYTAEQYLDLLGTFSNHRALPEANREGLFACLRRRIEAEPAQKITKSVAFELSSALAR